MLNKGIFYKISTITIFLIVSFLLLLPVEAEVSQVGFYPAKVKDISDRAYEKAVIELIDNAQESIVISMYVLRLGDFDKHPINRLMKDLDEALERGVRVVLYLNTNLRVDGHYITNIGEGKGFEILRQKGAKIYLTTPSYRLHDKMIIVDRRYVVIGSTNWTVSSLTRNFESSVLIDSPLLAEKRLERMKTIHLKGEDVRGPPQISVMKLYSLPELIKLPKALMNEKKYFPRMLSKQDNRAMDLYLLLLAEAKRRKSKEFYISLEDTAINLNMPENWTKAALRRQVIKSLRKLKHRYKLIDVQFKYARAAKIKLLDISDGEAFGLGRQFFEPSFLAKHPQNAKFVLLIKAYLKEEGKDMADFSQSELSRMFKVSRMAIGDGIEWLLADSS